MITKTEISFVKSLKDKRSRDEHNVFIGEGEKFVRELLASDVDVVTIYCSNQALALDLVRLTDNPLKIITVTAKEIERISLFKTPSDVVAIASKPVSILESIAFDQELVLALDEIQDPGNLGTIIRIADWFGIQHIVCSPNTTDCFNPKVVQATMGALMRINIHYTPLKPFLESANVPVYGTLLEGENIYDAKLGRSGIIVMGNEGHGISKDINVLITRMLHIPPHPIGGNCSESLNVAVATAIVCSEFRRRI